MIALKQSTENRFYPRIHLNKPVNIRLPDGQEAPDSVHDISKIGFQLRCDRALAMSIHPDQSVISEEHSPSIRLAIRLPYPENLPEIVVDCRLRYLNVIGPDEIAFGVMFEEFLGDGTKQFERFIHQCLIPVCPAMI